MWFNKFKGENIAWREGKTCFKALLCCSPKKLIMERKQQFSLDQGQTN